MQNRRDTLWQRHGDLSRAFVDRGFISTIAERLDLPPRRYRSTGDLDSPRPLDAVLSCDHILVVTLVQSVRRTFQCRKVRDHDLRLCRGKVSGIRNRYGHTTAGDRTDRITDLIGENVILRRFFAVTETSYLASVSYSVL